VLKPKMNVSVSGKIGKVSPRSRLEQTFKRLGLVSVSKEKVLFASLEGGGLGGNKGTTTTEGERRREQRDLQDQCHTTSYASVAPLHLRKLIAINDRF